jgi:hypothetical protein
MNLLENMIAKAGQLADQLQVQWKRQIIQFIKDERKKGHDPSKAEIIAKFKSDSTRRRAVEMLGWSDKDVEDLVGEALREA